MTVGQLREVLPNSEYHQWRAFFHWRNEMEKLEASKRG